VSLVLDAGALVALEHDQRAMWARLKAAWLAGERPVTHGGVLGQVWRGGHRQARLAQALAGVDVRPLDERLGRSAGALLASSGGSDVVDAAVMVLAHDGDDIVTADLTDFEVLAAALGRHVELIRP
jgi:hypothetical protein